MMSTTQENKIKIVLVVYFLKLRRILMDFVKFIKFLDIADILEFIV